MAQKTPWLYSIKTRLIVSFSLVIGVISVFIYIFFPYKLEQQALQLLKARTHSIAEITTSYIEKPFAKKDFQTVENSFDGVKQNPDLLYIVMHNERDDVVATFNLEKAEKAHYNTIIEQKNISLDEGVYKLRMPVVYRNQNVGTMFMGFSLVALQANTKATSQLIAFVALGIFVISILFVGGLSTIFTQPLSKMVQVVNAISKGDFNHRVNITSDDELGYLAKSFNRMVYNIQRINSTMESVNQRLQTQNEEILEQKTRLEEVNLKQEKTYETMRRQEARLMAILDNFSGEIWSIDRQYEILICNKPFQWSAEKRGAFIGMGDNALDDRQGPAYRKQWKKLYDRALANERFTQIITKEEADGKTRFIEYLFNPITAYNEVMGVAVLGLDITRRKEDEAEKIRLNQELNEAARRAGMADVAASVLHNVGNVLTSVTTSVSVIEQTMSNSRMVGLYKANDMLRENMENLAHFIANDPKGKKLIQYYMMLEDQIKSEQDVIFSNLHRLQDKVNIINEVIAAQQSYATGSMLSENLYLPQVIDDALRLQGDTTDRHHIELIEEYEDNIPEVPLQRTKLIHIIVNLFRNAKDAMKDTPMDEKQIKIRLNRENEHLVLRFSDSGCGIEPENVERIFNHGFTTKATGHGFGLHSCANYITEMGGRMWVESEGLGKGSTFVLQFPLAAKQGQETPEIIDEEV